MPIYEYECDACHRRCEYLQSFSEAPKSVCEVCGGRLAKLISAGAFHLKGTGWYKTDYASSKSSGSASSDHGSKESAATATSGGDKAEKTSEGSPEKAAPKAASASDTASKGEKKD